MSKLPYRGPIALAAVAVALLWSKGADAQLLVPPPPPWVAEPGGFINNVVTGVEFDLVDKALAERRLQKLQAKIRRDSARGHSGAVNRDARWIQNTQYRIVVEDWLIRKNSCQQLGYYPPPLRLDPMSCAAIGQYHNPPLLPDPWRPFPTP